MRCESHVRAELESSIVQQLASLPCAAPILLHSVVTSIRSSAWRMTATFDSVFRIYPNAALMVHMTEGNASASVAALLSAMPYRRQRNVTIRALDLRSELESIGGEYPELNTLVGNLTSRWRQLTKHRFWFSHEGDFARCLLLLRYGGVYLDTDVLLVRRLPTPACSTDLAEGLHDASARWAFIGRQTDTRDPRYRSAYLNGAVLGADAGHPWLRALLSVMLERYTARRDWMLPEWTVIGPHAVTEATRQHNANDPLQAVSVLPTSAFQPLSFHNEEQLRCFSQNTTCDDLRRVRFQDSMAVHLNSQHTARIRVGPGSLCALLYRELAPPTHILDI
jgi:hypothetical protein